MLLKDVASCWRRWLAGAASRCGGMALRLAEAARRSGRVGAAVVGGALLLLLLLLLLLCMPFGHIAPGEPQAPQCDGCWLRLHHLMDRGGCGDLPLLLAAEGAGSVCGAAADRRGPHQKVAAFSFYGDVRHHRGYFKGIAENAALLAALLPGWVMRVYHEAPPPPGPGRNGSTLQALSLLQARFPHLDLCDATRLPRYRDLSGRSQMLWRLLPAADPLVDVFISRDLDSRLSSREADAVREWLEGGLSFHVMRDNLEHHVPVMGGMWGARLERRRSELRLVVDVVVACQWEAARDDQVVLAAFVWPLMKGHRFGSKRDLVRWLTAQNGDPDSIQPATRRSSRLLPKICLNWRCRPRQLRRFVALCDEVSGRRRRAAARQLLLRGAVAGRARPRGAVPQQAAGPRLRGQPRGLGGHRPPAGKALPRRLQTAPAP